MSEDDEASEFAQALGQIMCSSKHNWDEFTNLVEQLESVYVSDSNDNDFEVVEVRRRCTEATMLTAAVTRQPLPTLVAIYERLTQLGFSDILRRIEMTIIHARHCAKASDYDRAIRLLSDSNADGEIKDSPDYADSTDMSAELIDGWRQRIGSAQTPGRPI